MASPDAVTHTLFSHDPALEPRRRTERVAELTRLLAEARSGLEALQAQSAVAPAGETADLVRQARRDLLLSRIQQAQDQIFRYEKELAHLTATAGLAPLRLDLAARRACRYWQERGDRIQ